MLGGGDSSDSEEEGSGASGYLPAWEGRVPGADGTVPAEESCAMKRKPSRSASNAPPNKKKEERKSEPEEDAPKLNFTGRKTSEKRKWITFEYSSNMRFRNYNYILKKKSFNEKLWSKLQVEISVGKL